MGRSLIAMFVTAAIAEALNISGTALMPRRPSATLVSRPRLARHCVRHIMARTEVRALPIRTRQGGPSC
jgi:hypothetical protein